jgi:putative sigma-54 modulation protein
LDFFGCLQIRDLGNSVPRRIVVQIKISTRHGHTSDHVQKHIQEKAGKLLHFFDRISMIEVTLDHQRELKVVELAVNAEHKHDFFAKEENADLYTAIDNVIEKVEHQIQKYKEKIQDHRKTPPMGELPKSL